VIYQDLNPAWNETFELLLADEQLSSEVLRVQVLPDDDDDCAMMFTAGFRKSR
jgi:hypothetical protein